MLGSTGINGSVWVLLGEKLIASGAFNQIVLVPAAVGGSSVAKWREGGDLYKMLKDRLQDLKANRIEVTHFLWHQGESDNPYVEPEANLTSASPSMAA